MTKHKYDCILALTRAGISEDDARALRRIAMTFSAWDEAECGSSDDYASRGIERDEVTGKPYRTMIVHKEQPYRVHRYPIQDRERSTNKRLAEIMARYPDFVAYHQSDCRGLSLYILRPSDLIEGNPRIDEYYSRGIGVGK